MGWGSLLLASTLALLPPEGVATAGGSNGIRTRVLEAINADRAAAGLAPLELAPELVRVAQERARELAAAGSPTPRQGDVSTVSRRLFRLGYRAHAWTERALLGSADPFAHWRAEGGEGYEEAVLGDFQELGVGFAEADGLALVTLLFALPRREVERRATAPLADLTAVREAVLARVNQARRQRGRPPLAADPRLDAAAQAHARDMLERGYYAHQSPEGAAARERAVAAGYRPRRVGENIAKGLFAPAEVVERWLGSRGHRANLLSPAFTHLGVGVAFGPGEEGVEVLWVQVLAAPR